jgi:hypothetical protein
MYLRRSPQLSPISHHDNIYLVSRQKDQPPTAGLENVFLRCLLKRVKTQLRVPKMQRATFLNNIVTVNTDFS